MNILKRKKNEGRKCKKKNARKEECMGEYFFTSL
jgi:hypothetical protein